MNHARTPKTTPANVAADAISLRDFALHKLNAISAALGRPELGAQGGSILRELTDGWPDAPLGATPSWPSDITDDASPFEYSLTFGAGRAPELRVLCEPQGEGFGRDASWAEGLRVSARLAERYGADLSAFARVADLFAPLPSIPSRFCLWHSAVLGDAGPTFKVYLNPWIAGADAAPQLVDRALARLGYSAATASLSRQAPFVYFALDLVGGPSARTKVYAAHHRASCEAIATRLPAAQQRDVARFVGCIAGTDAVLDGRPVQTCHAFRAGGADAETTIYVPVRSYVDHDAQAVERAAEYLRPADAEALREVVHALAERPLSMGRGLVTYVALRPSDGRVSVYLSPEAYAILAPRRAPRSAPPKESMIRELAPGAAPRHGTTIADVQETVGEHRARIARHPFLVHLQERATVADVQAVAPHVAFFVLCFQDVLRLVHEHTTDPELKAIAETHRQEDSGHDLWYLHDLDRLGVTLGVRDLFADERARIRDVAYTQIADAIRSSDDRSRLGVVLALEAAGAEFFGSMIAGLERLAHDDGLLYFARPHQKVEQSHDLFDEHSSHPMGSIPVPDDVLPEVLAVIARTFATMNALADELLALVEVDAAAREAS